MKGLISGSKILKNSDLFLQDRGIEFREIIEEVEEEELFPERLIMADDLRNSEEFVWHPRRKF